MIRLSTSCRRAFTAAAVIATASAALAAAEGGSTTPTGAPTAIDLTIDRDGFALAATLTVPRASAPVPAMVVIHGSGTSDRGNAWTTAWTEALVARGVAVLHPDKRGSGASGGDWKTVGFEVLAGDAIAAARVLSARPEIDASRIGVIGFSQGGLIAPIAAADPTISFAVSVSSSVLPFEDLVRDEVVLAARRAGLDARQVDQVAHLQDTANAYAHSEIAWEVYEAELDNARKSIPDPDNAVVGPFPTTADDWVWGWVRAVGDFDPIPYWKAADVPSLFVWGGRDPRLDTGRNVARATDQLVTDDKPVTLLVHADEGHAFIRNDTLDFVARWIRNGGSGE